MNTNNTDASHFGCGRQGLSQCAPMRVEGLRHCHRPAGALPGKCTIQIAADLYGCADLLFHLTESFIFFIFVKS